MVCLKSNGLVSQTIHYNVKQPMHFILLCQASVHYWKDSSGIPFSLVLTAPLQISTPSKRFFQFSDVPQGQEQLNIQNTHSLYF